MPQLDPTFFTSQLFWLAVAFGLLYLFLWRFGLPRVTGVLQHRRDRIAGDLEKAEKMKKEAEKLNNEYVTSLGEVRAKANSLIAEAVAKAKAESERRHAALDAEIHARFQESDKALAKARKDALRNIQDIAVELSAMIAKKVAGISVSEDKARKSVQSVVEEKT